MAELDFPRTPDGTLGELWSACLRLLPQLSRRVRRSVAVATTSTPVAHGLGFAPQSCNVIPQGDARVWEASPPDAKCVHLAASVAVLVNVEFIP